MIVKCSHLYVILLLKGEIWIKDLKEKKHVLSAQRSSPHQLFIDQEFPLLQNWQTQEFSYFKWASIIQVLTARFLPVHIDSLALEWNY